MAGDRDVSPLLTLEQVTAVRDGAVVLRDIDLTIRPGEGWLLTGGNGAGKSTLLALLAGRLWPAPGRGRRRYDFGDGPEHDAVSAQQRVALVGPALQQDYHRFGWNFRGIDIVLSGLQRAPVPQRRVAPWQRERAGTLLAEYRLEHLAARRLLTLSSGEQRALLILRVLAARPALLLIDEPFESLDAERRARLAAVLHRLAAGGQTLVVAQPEAPPELAFLRRRLHLDGGRETAPPDTAAARAWPTGLPAPATQPLVELRNVSVSPGDDRVLHGINWTLNRGERWLLHGANGAGKSTLLRLLHGDCWPELGGELRWHDHRADAGVWALRRRVRLVSPQLQIRYHRGTRVLDCVLSGHVAGIGVTATVGEAERDEARALLARFGLDRCADTPVGRLSHGQLRRVLIARTLVGRPALLLLDEPLGGLDADARGMLHDALRDAVQGGVSLVMASHEDGVPAGLFTHEMRLENGRVTTLRPLREDFPGVGRRRAPRPEP